MSHRIAEGIEVAWVQTEDGPVRLDEGDTLPDNVSEDEVARLANGGVLEGFDQVDVPDPGDPGDEPTPVDVVGVDETKVRVGNDPDTARVYLDAELLEDKPRKTLVAHLEHVIAGTNDGDPVVASSEGTEGA